jgi:hypothetical protein
MKMMLSLLSKTLLDWKRRGYNFVISGFLKMTDKYFF